MDEVRADETGATGYKHSCHLTLHTSEHLIQINAPVVRFIAENRLGGRTVEETVFWPSGRRRVVRRGNSMNRDLPLQET